MRHFFCTTVLLIIIFIVAGCSLGGAKFPTASEGYQPKRIHNIEKNKLFEKVASFLESERLTIKVLDKENGRIVTDYIQGETQFLIIMSLTTRYNYTIRFKNLENNKTKIDIICRLESLAANLGWHDVGKDNVTIVKRLENWLYEKIENNI